MSKNKYLISRGLDPTWYLGLYLALADDRCFEFDLVILKLLHDLDPLLGSPILIVVSVICRDQCIYYLYYVLYIVVSVICRDQCIYYLYT